MEDDKPKSNGGLEALGGILALGLLILAWPAIYAYLNPAISGAIGPLGLHWAMFENDMEDLIEAVVVISFPVSLFFLIGIIYSVEQLKAVRAREVEKYDLKVEPAFEDSPGQGNHDLSLRWKKANDLLNSSNPNDWKQAILEADTMLDEILSGLGYQGESIGEKLKRVQPGEVKNLDDAWEAHKVRNQIAHDGSFALTQNEAVQTLHRYRKVFEEFYYI